MQYVKNLLLYSYQKVRSILPRTVLYVAVFTLLCSYFWCFGRVAKALRLPQMAEWAKAVGSDFTAD